MRIKHPPVQPRLPAQTQPQLPATVQNGSRQLTLLAKLAWEQRSRDLAQAASSKRLTTKGKSAGTTRDADKRKQGDFYRLMGRSQRTDLDDALDDFEGR